MRQDHRLQLPDGRTLGYSQLGAPDGRPLLYFHGGVSSRLDIDFANQFCVDNNISIFAPDRPGIGISSTLADRSLLQWSDDTEQLLEHLKIGQIPLLGWSLAGAYVFACAYKIPHRLTRVSTIGGVSPILPPVQLDQLGLLADRFLLNCPPAFEGVLAAALDASGKLPPQAVRFMLESELSGPDRVIVQKMTLAQATDFIIESMRQGGMGVVEDYRAVAQPWNFEWSEIKTPVTLWHGQEDKLCPLTMPAYLKEKMPHATLNIVPGKGHFLLHEMLEEVLLPLVQEP